MNNRQVVICQLLEKYQESFFIFSNGLTSREAAHIQSEDRCFYLLHAMGEALSVGYGLAISQPDLEIVVIDGDYNALMGLSSWSLMPIPNLKYFVLANGTSATTGGQEIPPLPFIPNWCNVISIIDENIITPNPPMPDEIWEKSQNWIIKFRKKGAKDERSSFNSVRSW